MPHVARRKHSRHICFQIIGRAVERPSPVPPQVPRQIRSSNQIPIRIADNSHLLRPFRSRRAANAGEKPLGRNLLRLLGPVVANFNALQCSATGKSDHARVGHHRHIRRRSDPVDQILRQGILQRVAAHHDRYMFRILQKIQRRLSRRIPSTHHHYMLSGAQHRFARTGAVI